ncbi:MAG: pyridoxal phosphate-dependent aminotransferase [Clostridia bacterium]|nr:pyridoxal phosphate-dependent aminotransferase [Clostridia bacterium]
MFDREYFDAGLYRIGTDCEKWDGCRKREGGDVLPMWVADMDFQSPPAIREALLRRAAHPTWGYTEVTDADIDAPRDFWARRHGVSVTREEVTLLPCVVTGLKLAILSLTKPGDGVIIQSPVYGPFRMSVQATGRTLMDAPLTADAHSRYTMDLEAVERQCRAGAKLMMLCSPHNPVSRVWSREELQALLNVLNRYGVPLVSDEIHADFVYAPARFESVLSLQRTNVLTLCAASKTFNVAGLQTAFMFCSDEAIRTRYQETITASGVVSGNIFGVIASRAAFEQGDAWLDGLLDYLDGNRKELAEQVAEFLPGAVLTPVEATYLAWLDLRSYGFTCEELAKRTAKARVVFTGGTFFGDNGEGFLRVNFACPRRNIGEAIRRLKNALEA